MALQADNERNFHIFYQLIAGADDEMREEFFLQPAEEYAYLNKSGCIEIEGTDDAHDFRENCVSFYNIHSNLLCTHFVFSF